MILYHTSMMEIPVPDIHRGRVNADFGQGFYLTPDQEFSYRWALQDSVVNRFMIGPEYTQVVVKSQKAADQLKWIGAERITGVKEYKASLKREQEEYQEQFAMAVEKMGGEDRISA